MPLGGARLQVPFSLLFRYSRILGPPLILSTPEFRLCRTKMHGDNVAILPKLIKAYCRSMNRMVAYTRVGITVAGLG